jgi:hypothetical protein
MFLAIGICALLLIFALAISSSSKKDEKIEQEETNINDAEKQDSIPAVKVLPKELLSQYERIMHQMLREALPENYIIQCQVSFNAFLKCSDIGLRNTFNRKNCDYLIVNEYFLPICVVELDDRSHKYSAKKDKQRDELLKQAHITTVRFNNLPNSINEIKSRIYPILEVYETSKLLENTYTTLPKE